MKTKDIKTDIEIARNANKKHIKEIVKTLGIKEQDISQYGNDKAKLSQDFIDSIQNNKNGKLILVTAISPTPAGEGKTTTSVGLNDGLNIALNKTDRKSVVCLREPSLGPCFGMKGGAAGGGLAQVIPMEDINLHFTGDFHAISAAHNLLAAMIDNHINWENKLNIDIRRISFGRVVDMNDRALRKIICSMGGAGNGFPRETGYEITVASEIMAIFCLADSLKDLENRIGNIIIGYTKDKKPITARDLEADGAMTVLLKDAFMPNIVQTLENNPAFIHGGPFANIAHGCNSVISTKTALKLSDFVITEAGFGADLGAEKFFDIKCRKANLKPDAVVLVATIRALKMHGGISKDNLVQENVEAVKKGCANLIKHIENIKKFKLNVVVAINHFITDSEAEMEVVQQIAKQQNTKAIVCKHWSEGGAGTIEMAEEILSMIKNNQVSNFEPIYPLELPLLQKVEIIAKELYGASEVSADAKVIAQLKQWETDGFGNLPVCIAKTQYSFSTNPSLMGAPKNHKIDIREVKLSAGAEFVVIICGAVMTMPGLPRKPAANNIKLDNNGLIQGLF